MTELINVLHVTWLTSLFDRCHQCQCLVYQRLKIEYNIEFSMDLSNTWENNNSDRVL